MTNRRSLLLILFFAFAAPLAAQVTVQTLTMSGRLTTAADSPAPDRNIFAAPAGCCVCSCRENGGDYYCCSDKLRLCCAGLAVGGRTDEKGEFRLSLPPGKYDVFFDSVADSTKLVRNVDVGIGRTATLELRLPEPTRHHRRMHKD